MQLKFSKNRVKSLISGAVPFEHPLSTPVHKGRFFKKRISFTSIRKLCEKLDPVQYHHQSMVSFFQDNLISIGPKKNIEEEFKRVLSKNKKYIKGLLLGFPFKCPVPIKTNYHTLPDFGECMFIYRLGKLCQEVSQHTQKRLVINVAEETNALATVFEVKNSICKTTQKKLAEYTNMLGFKEYIKFISLSSLIASDEKKYKKKLTEEASYIEKNVSLYQTKLYNILPTIALSLPINSLTLLESRKLINRLFSNTATVKEHRTLLKTAYKYLAFTELQQEQAYRNKIENYLQLSLCPKKGRVGIRPTVSSSKLFPHHGVPVVYIKSGTKKFKIEYYIDFLTNSKENKASEVYSPKGDFLYYEVQN